MLNQPTLLIDDSQGSRSLVPLASLSFVVGAFAGLVGASFRILLQSAEGWRTYVISRLQLWGWLGFPVLVLGTALVAAFAAWLVFRFAPQSSGSGIPNVEHQLKIGWSGNPVPTVIVKFVGGILAIGGGLALGREGPTVQMGAGIGHIIGRAFHRNENECRVLLAAGAGAGLATAFNAPIAGAIFVLEELVGVFDLPVTVSTLGASAAAIAVSRVFLGQSPDFRVPALDYAGFGVLPASLLLGAVLGLVGVAYNLSLVRALDLTARFSRLHGTLRAACIGAFVGLVGWFVPSLIGAGDALTQSVFDSHYLFAALLSSFALRFFLGPLSYAARTPGGLFAPMLTVGSQAGLLFFMLWTRLLTHLASSPQQFAIVGIAAFFAAVVRAPLTGIVLAVELTGSFSLFLPMLGASFAAALTASILKNPPIYESLREGR